MNAIEEGSFEEYNKAMDFASRKFPNLEYATTKSGYRGCIKANVSNRNTLVIGYWRLWRETQGSSSARIQRATMLTALAEEDHEECPICLEPISEGLVVLKCKHKFCASCFAQHARSDNKCGLCRDQFAPPAQRTQILNYPIDNGTDIQTILDDVLLVN
jgi:hypothetical protein